MYHHLFQLKKGSTAEEALAELEQDLLHLYEMEDPETGIAEIGGYSEEKELPPYAHAIPIQSKLIPEIDWAQQWESFAPGFHNGGLEIPLENALLKLKPGGGFGDLSHPTTRLVLAMMQEHAREKTVIDIGCGSGILSIAAALVGAKRAIGIDIDPIALEHSAENARLNHVEERTHFTDQIKLYLLESEPLLILMNMIQSEQKIAWSAHPILHGRKAILITSGILASEKEKYLSLAKSWGWTLEEIQEEEEWLAFRFSQ